MAACHPLTEIGLKKKTVTFDDDVEVLEFEREPKVQLSWWEKELAKSGVFFKHRPNVPITNDIMFEDVLARHEARIEAKRQERLEIAKMKDEFEELWKIRERDGHQIKENGPGDDLGQSDEDIQGVVKEFAQRPPKNKIVKTRRKIAFDAGEKDSENDNEICMITNQVSKCVQSDEGFMSGDENIPKEISVNGQSANNFGLKSILKKAHKQHQNHIPVMYSDDLLEEELKFPEDKTYAQIMRDRRGPKFKPDLSILFKQRPLTPDRPIFNFMSQYWMYSSDDEEKKQEKEKEKKKKKKKKKVKKEETVATPKFEIFVESESLMEENREAWNLHMENEELEKLAKEKLEKEMKEAKRRLKKDFKKNYVKVSERVNPRFMMPPFDRPLSQCFELYLKKDHIVSDIIDYNKKKKEVSIVQTPQLEYTLGSFENSVQLSSVVDSTKNSRQEAQNDRSSSAIMNRSVNSIGLNVYMENSSHTEISNGYGSKSSIALNDDNNLVIIDDSYHISRKTLYSEIPKELSKLSIAAPKVHKTLVKRKIENDFDSSPPKRAKESNETNEQPFDLTKNKEISQENPIVVQQKDSDSYQKFRKGLYSPIPKENLKLLNFIPKQTVVKCKSETDFGSSPPKFTKVNDESNEQPFDLTENKETSRENPIVIQQKVPVPLSVYEKDGNVGINHKGNIKMINLTLKFGSSIDLKFAAAVAIDPINSQSIHETSHMRAFRFPELTAQQLAERLASGTHGLCIVPLHH